MLVEYNSLSENSTIFIYPASRKLYKNEEPLFQEKINTFLTNFEEIKAAFEIKYSRFLIIFIDTSLSLNQNDVLVQFILSLEKEFNISLLDKVNVCFKQGEYAQLKEIPDFKNLIKNKGVSKKTIVFNNLIHTKTEYENSWETPAEDSWVSHFFK